MESPEHAPRPKRLLLASGGLVSVLVAATLVGAPGVEATCGQLLDLAEQVGESPGPEGRRACVQHYEGLRARRGLLAWTYTSWCTRLARSFPEAGEC